MIFHERKSLDQYVDKSSQARDFVEPIVNHIKYSRFKTAEQKFAYATLAIIDEVSEGIMEPAEADKVFTLLDIYLGDNFEPPMPFSELFFDILFEGMLLHHYGDDTGFGPDLNQIEKMAGSLLK